MMLEARPQISQNNKLYLKKSFSQMQGTLVLNECLVIQYTRRKNKAYLFNEHIHKFINDTVFLCGEHMALFNTKMHAFESNSRLQFYITKKLVESHDSDH